MNIHTEKKNNNELKWMIIQILYENNNSRKIFQWKKNEQKNNEISSLLKPILYSIVSYI